MPYLLSGRRALLDELQAQAAWNVLSVWPLPRREAGAARGVNIIWRREVRSAAWGMRQLDEAAWISPDSDPQQGYFRDVAARNWAWMRERIPVWTEWQGEAHGWLPNTIDHIAPWQQDYLASSVAAAARRGNDDARAVLAWMANFLVGRFQAGDRGMNPRDGIAFTIATAPRGAERPEQLYKSWAEIGAATVETGRSNGDGWKKSEGDYGRLALQSLALLQNVLGHEGARRAYLWLLSAGAPGTAPESYASNPTHSIGPRDMPRVPSRVVRCQT